jgi:nicotinate phosphoribosyltransferase
MQGPYGQSLTLLTDLYQLTMAYGYWKHGMAEREACFHLYAREAPFGSPAMLAAGLEPALGWLKSFRFMDDDCSYLASLKDANGDQLFSDEFLRWLAEQRFSCDIDAVEEGVAVFPETPLLRVRGPLWQAQVLETPLLNIINFQTLIATKAARVCDAADGESVLEFGLRRAQGVDGGLSASRAAYIGGCSGTSNVLAGKLFGIPVRGTHAHSWVMVFEDELEAFRKYASGLPDPCILLVDTYDTIEGIKRAIKVGRELRKEGRDLAGVRLDSGDLASLSMKARRMLDEAGFQNTTIVGSSSLDEHKIEKLKSRGAAITVWGVGTRLVTAEEQPALGGVYKISGIRNASGEWQPRIKVSDNPAKTSYPGVLQTLRFMRGDAHIADVVVDSADEGHHPRVVIPFDDTQRKVRLDGRYDVTPLLRPVFRDGESVYRQPPIDAVRARGRSNWKKFGDLKRPVVGLEERLHETREELIRAHLPDSGG